ncbi:MAG: hypothetical protein K8T10_12000 [Candidatus Eremiobacteraeota bacterium]|nr:hypothetical protein [Candidatus Eremiobacteraeota bacterium]
MKNKTITKVFVVLVICIIVLAWIIYNVNTNKYHPAASTDGLPSPDGAKTQRTTISTTPDVLQLKEYYEGIRIILVNKMLAQLIDEAECNYNNNKYYSCIKIYNKIKAIAEDNKMVVRYRIHTRLGAAYVNIAESNNNMFYAKEAINNFLIAIQDDPDDTLAILDTARAHIVMAKRTKDKKYLKMAKEELKKAKSISRKNDPDDKKNIRAMARDLEESHLNMTLYIKQP